MSGVLIFLILAGVTCCYALWQGGGPERVTSAALILAIAGSIILFQFSDEAFARVEIGIAALDHALLAVLMIVMMKADRLWPIAMFGMHLLNCSSHWVRYEDAGLLGTIYAIISQSWGYPMQILLAVATLMHQRRLRLHGVDRSWLTS